MNTPSVLHRWDDLDLDKVTEMVSRKAISAGGQALVQTYLKKGALVPRHAHDGAQWVYVLQGALDVTLGGQPPLTLRDGEVLHIPAGLVHQAEAVEDTFVLDVRT